MERLIIEVGLNDEYEGYGLKTYPIISRSKVGAYNDFKEVLVIINQELDAIKLEQTQLSNSFHKNVVEEEIKVGELDIKSREAYKENALLLSKKLVGSFNWGGQEFSYNDLITMEKSLVIYTLDEYFSKLEAKPIKKPSM